MSEVLLCGWSWQWKCISSCSSCTQIFLSGKNDLNYKISLIHIILEAGFNTKNCDRQNGCHNACNNNGNNVSVITMYEANNWNINEYLFILFKLPECALVLALVSL